MKAYYQPNQFRLVGKAWEVRHYLKQFAQSATSLQDFLQARTNAPAVSAAHRPRLTIVK